MGWKLTRKGWEKTDKGGENLVIGGQKADYFQNPPPPGQWIDPEGRPLNPDGTLDVERFIELFEKGKGKR